MFLYQEMKEKIDYFVEKVNEPLAKVIIVFAGRYPEPTRENCQYHNTHILLDIQAEFFKKWDFKSRTPLVKALWRVLIVKYEHCPNYRYALDWILMKIPDDWKPFDTNRQIECWKGDRHG